MKSSTPSKSKRTHYDRTWRIIDGAVRECFATHPEYLRPGYPEKIIRASIVKRVTGAVEGRAVQAARGRFLAGRTADSVGAGIGPHTSRQLGREGGALAWAPPKLASPGELA